MKKAKLYSEPVMNPAEFISIPELREFSVLQPWKSTISILFQYISIASAIFIAEWFDFWPLTVFCLIFIGARIYSLGILVHEGLHYRLSNNKNTNDIILKYFLAWPIFINPYKFRHNHSMHHKHLYSENDPELGRTHGDTWEFPMKKIKLAGIFLLDLTGISLPFMLIEHKGYFSANNVTKKKIEYAKWIYYTIIFSTLIYFGLFTSYLFYWILPMVTWGNLLIRVRRISEHCGLNINNELISRSRTTRANLIERTFIAPNHINFHNEHHLFPSVPCYRLPELHRFLMNRESYRNKVHVCNGYWNVFKECTI